MRNNPGTRLLRDPLNHSYGRWPVSSHRFRWGHRLALLARPLLLLAWAGCAMPGYAADDATATRQVLEHHENAARTGLFVVPSLTWERARNAHRDPNFHADVDGAVYAQPLFWKAPGNA